MVMDISAAWCSTVNHYNVGQIRHTALYKPETFFLNFNAVQGLFNTEAVDKGKFPLKCMFSCIFLPCIVAWSLIWQLTVHRCMIIDMTTYRASLHDHWYDNLCFWERHPNHIVIFTTHYPIAVSNVPCTRKKFQNHVRTFFTDKKKIIFFSYLSINWYFIFKGISEPRIFSWFLDSRPHSLDILSFFFS